MNWVDDKQHMCPHSSGESQMEMLVHVATSETPLPGPQTIIPCALTWWKGQGVSSSHLKMALFLFMRAELITSQS